MNRHILMNKPDKRHLDQAYRNTTSQYLGTYLSASFIFRSKTQLKVKRAQIACQKQGIVLEYTHFFSTYSDGNRNSQSKSTLPVLFSDLRWTICRNVYRFTKSAPDIFCESEKKVYLCLARYLKAIHNVLQTLHIKEIHIRAILTAVMRGEVLSDILKSLCKCLF